MVNLSDAHEKILSELISMEKTGKLDRIAFEDIPIEVYHHPSCPGFSSTRIKLIVERNFNYAQSFSFESTPAMQFGTAFHSLIQGRAQFAKEYSVGKHDGVRQYISFDDYGKLQIMVANVEAHPEAGELLKQATHEWTFFSRCPITGVLRKVRPDIFKNSTIGDWKTTVDASPVAFARASRRLLYRVSARYYLDVVTDVLKKPMTDFKLIACENEGLFEVAVYPVHESSLAEARQEVDAALSAIARANEGGWRGYALNQNPIFI